MARTVADIQREMKGLPTSFSLSSRGGGAQVGGAEWQKKQALQKELTSLQQTEQYPTGTVVGAAQTAMEETQRRAEEDRLAALAEMRAGKEEALGEDYTGWKGALGEMETGEYGEDIKEAMAAKAAIPIESQTQQMIKDIQRSYYGGGTPGGMQQMLTQQAKLSKIGQLGASRRGIEIGSEEARQRGLGIKEARMGELAKYRGGVSTGTASKLADILGHTITAVPDYSQVPAVRSTGGGGGTTVRSGGSSGSSGSGGGLPRIGGMSASQRFTQRAREPMSTSMARHKAALKASGGFF